MKTSQGRYLKKLKLSVLTIYTRAIALSLQEANRKPGLIELDSDDDDEEAQFQKDLKRALLKSSAEALQSGSHPAIASTSSQQPDRSAQSATNAFLSERAQLERERRERQKRLRPSSRKSIEDEESEDEEPPAKRHQVSTSVHHACALTYPAAPNFLAQLPRQPLNKPSGTANFDQPPLSMLNRGKMASRSFD